MRMLRFLTIELVSGLLLLWAFPAHAGTSGSWFKGCAGLGDAETRVHPGESICYEPDNASDSDESPIINTGRCENFDVFQHDVKDGVGSACTVQWTIESCPRGPGILDTDAKRDAACAPMPVLDGDAILVADDAVYGLSADWMRVNATTAGTDDDNCQIVVKCAQGP